jgi:hypothetical protein
MGADEWAHDGPKLGPMMGAGEWAHDGPMVAQALAQRNYNTTI